MYQEKAQETNEHKLTRYRTSSGPGSKFVPPEREETVITQRMKSVKAK